MKRIFEIFLVGVSISVLVVGYEMTANRFSLLYKCNAVRFVYGAAGVLEKFRQGDGDMFKCVFLSSGGDKPVQTLPVEYPILSLVPMLLPLLAGTSGYDLAYRVQMGLVFVVIYAAIKKWKSEGAAKYFLILGVLGGFSTLLGRIDLLVGGLILAIVRAVEVKRFNLAYVLAAAATLIKIFPIILLPLIFIFENKGRLQKLKQGNLNGVGIFMLICFASLAVSVFINPFLTVSPLIYAFNRPVQIESMVASVAGVFEFAGLVKLEVVNSFGSVNILAVRGELFLQMVQTLAIGIWAGIFIVICRKLAMGRMSFGRGVLIILVWLLLTSKVFSAQYLLWVIPLIAYLGRKNGEGKLWLLVGFLTTLVYPFLTGDLWINLWYKREALVAGVLIRNAVLLIIGMMVLTKKTDDRIISSDDGKG